MKEEIVVVGEFVICQSDRLPRYTIGNKYQVIKTIPEVFWVYDDLGDSDAWTNPLTPDLWKRTNKNEIVTNILNDL